MRMRVSLFVSIPVLYFCLPYYDCLSFLFGVGVCPHRTDEFDRPVHQDLPPFRADLVALDYRAVTTARRPRAGSAGNGPDRWSTEGERFGGPYSVPLICTP